MNIEVTYGDGENFYTETIRVEGVRTQEEAIQKASDQVRMRLNLGEFVTEASCR